MVKVECDGCKAPYQIDEKRIPPAGLKMRCPKCGTNLVVTKPAEPSTPITEGGSPFSTAGEAGFGEPPPSSKRNAVGEPGAAPPVAGRAARLSKAFGALDQKMRALGLDAAPTAEATKPPEPRPLPVIVPVTRASDPEVAVPVMRPFDVHDDLEDDLPAALQLPKRSAAFGELDLFDAPASDPPMPASDPPMLSDADPAPFDDGNSDFGEIELPLLRHENTLQEHAPPPPVAHARRPPPPAFRAAPAAPLAQSAVAPALPAVRKPADDPPRVIGAIQRVATLPDTSEFEGALAEIGKPVSPFENAVPAGLPASREVRAPWEPRPVPAPAPPPPIERNVGAAASGQAPIGDELELAQDATRGNESGAPAAMPPPKQPVEVDSEAPPRRRNRTVPIVVALCTLGLLGGGSLAFDPSIGAFGFNAASDHLNAKKYAAMVADLRRDAQRELDKDTAPAASRALELAKATRDATIRYRPAAAYCAFVAISRGLRFGPRGEDEVLARQLLTAVGNDGSNEAILARAARSIGSGQFDAARAVLTQLAATAPEDLDVAVLQGELELRTHAKAKAVAAWKRAVALGGNNNPRALFGLARAQEGIGDTFGAEATVRAVMEAAPDHPASRTMLAELLWRQGRDAEAIALVGPATEDPTLRAASSDREAVDALTLLGRIHLGRSRASAAEQAFAAALKIDPQAVQALIGSGELFYRSGRYSQAQARFEAAIRADGTNVLARVGAAKTALGLERMSEAKNQLKALRTENPTDPLVLYWLGRAEEVLGNKKEAEAAYKDAIEVGAANLDVVDAYVALAHLLSASGRSDDAHKTLQDASTKFPDLSALFRAKGDIALLTGRLLEAKQDFLDALKKDDDLGTRFKLGVTLRRLRAFGEATAVFDKIVAQDKDYPGLALERGLLFEETGHSDRAFEMYSDALKRAPNDVDLKLRVGSTQVMAGDPVAAEPILREVVSERPNSGEANHFLGRALLMAGANLTEAKQFLQAAVNSDANRAEYHLYLGWAMGETGQQRFAEEELNRALSLDHDLGDAYWRRGILLQKQGAIVDALSDLTEALQLRPSRFEAYATMALCYEDQQKWAEAEHAWRNAIAGNANVAEWHYRLGKLLEAHGGSARATPELEEAARLGDMPGAPSSSGWLYNAHMLIGEAYQGRNREKAIEHYKRFLELAPRENAYREEKQRWLQSVGAADPAPVQ